MSSSQRCFVCDAPTLMTCSNCEEWTCEMHLYVALGEIASDDGPIECSECLHEQECGECYSLVNAADEVSH